jgi:hypothetical protein
MEKAYHEAVMDVDAFQDAIDDEEDNIGLTSYMTRDTSVAQQRLTRLYSIARNSHNADPETSPLETLSMADLFKLYMNDKIFASETANHSLKSATSDIMTLTLELSRGTQFLRKYGRIEQTGWLEALASNDSTAFIVADLARIHWFRKQYQMPNIEAGMVNSKTLEQDYKDIARNIARKHVQESLKRAIHLYFSAQKH